jgi:hypothetical protein
MERRAFLAMLAAGAANAADAPRFSFAVLTDIEYADEAPNLKRDYRRSWERLSRAVGEINRGRPAFAIPLGDLVDGGQ